MTYARCVPAFVVASFLALGSTAAAQSPDGWFLGCKAFAEGRANTQPQLYGMQSYCSGVVHGLVAVGPLLPPRLQFCPPQASSPSELARVVVQYVEAQPERMHEDFRQLTLEAFHDAWPCKSER
jgi:Rap1a immunity proteins